MKNEQALERFAEVLIKKIETTVNDWKKPWISLGGSVGNNNNPRNIHGREYNASNSVMLSFLCMEKGYENPVFCTFNNLTTMNQGQPVEKHVKIKPKERSFPVVLRSKMYKNTETEEFIYENAYDELSEEEQEKYKELFCRKVYTVFNIHQTNMAEVRPDLWKKCIGASSGKPRTIVTEGDLYAPYEIMAGRQEWICPIKVDGNQPVYKVKENCIVVPARNQFFTTESYYGTMFHEMAHSTVVPTKRNTSSYDKEEIVAELTSALVCARLGMNTYVNEDSVPYLKEYVKKLKEDASIIKTLLDDVQKASRIIEGKMSKYEGMFYVELNIAA